MRALRVENGVVVEVFNATKEGLAGRYHPDFIAALHDAPDEVGLGYELRPDGTFALPEAPPLAGVKTALAERVREAANRRTVELSEGSTPEERDIHLLSAEVAMRADPAFVAAAAPGSAEAAALLAVEAAARGMSEAALRTLILAKRQLWTERAFALKAAKASALGAISAAQTSEAAFAAADTGIVAINAVGAA